MANIYFDYDKIEETYPEAGCLMFPPMLIWHLPKGKEDMLSKVCEDGEYFLEEKIDGALYQFVRTTNFTYMFSRTESRTNGLLVNKADNVPHITSALSCLPPNTIIIGEIYYDGGTAKDTVSIMGCLPALAIKKQESRPIQYYLHDIVYYDGVNLMQTGAEDRYNILAAVWKKFNLEQYDFLRLAKKIDSQQEEEISRILAAGGEGAVLKRRNGQYFPGKRPAWNSIKVKQMDHVDLVCTGFCDPTKEYTGKELSTWPYWEIYKPAFYDCFEEDHCFSGWWPEKMVDTNQFCLYNPHAFDRGNIFQSPRDEDRIAMPVTKPYYLGWKTAIEIGAYDEDGNLVKLGTVSSGLTDDLKHAFSAVPELFLNKVVELDCMSIDRNEKTLRHPVFKRFRDDKNASECKIKEIFG